jgi:hypothetical protein
MTKKRVIEPINLIMGFVAIIGAILIIVNKGDYGLILLIIATLIEALTRVLK